MAISTSAPVLTAPTLYGHSYTQPRSTLAPYLPAGARFAPTITLASATSGLVVKAGSTVLDATDCRFVDEIAGPGEFRLVLENDDPDLPAFDDVISFYLDGVLRFAGPVRGKDSVAYAPGEGAEELTTITGPGRMGAFRSLVAPSRGWDALPVEVTRSQSWMAPDFDDSSWPHAKRIRRADVVRPFTPYNSIPEWWPDKSAWWVAPNRGDISGTDAPVGDWPIRSDAITLAAGTIEILFSVNNLGPVFFDGALISDTANAPVDGNRVRLDVSAGDHVLAARITNYIRDTGFIASIWTVDDDGLLDDLVWSSDSSNMRALPYPSTFPGTNAGISIREFVEGWQADGEMLGVTLDFTDLRDSDGNPWTTVAEITTEVGRKAHEYLEALSDWLIDVQVAPGGDVIRAWNWGTRGGTPGVTIAATTNAKTSHVETLRFNGLHIRANFLRIRYRAGYTTVDLSGSDPVVPDFLDLTHINDEATAQAIGTNLLQLRKDPSYAGSIGLSPNSPQPYDDFGVGDTVTHPADPGGSTTSRVRSIAYDESDTAEAIWALELNTEREEVEARQENWLKRSAMGSLAGGAKVTSGTGDSIAPASKVSSKDVAEFSFDGALSVSTSPSRPASSSGNLIEVYVSLTTAGSTDTEVRVLQNGSSLGTITVAAGETEAELDLAGAKTYRNVDKFQADVITAGTDAEGLDVQVRAI